MPWLSPVGVSHVKWEHYFMVAELVSSDIPPTPFLPDSEPPNYSPSHSFPLTLGT